MGLLAGVLVGGWVDREVYWRGLESVRDVSESV